MTLSSQRVNEVQVAPAQGELVRCLRQLVELFPDPDFRACPPELVIDTGYPPVPEQPLETQPHLVTLYRRDLSGSTAWTLAVLLHKMIHAYHAFHWQEDCTRWSYHTRTFRRLAEQVGFQVGWVRHYGWAYTVPTEGLRRVFEDLAVSEELLQPFRNGLGRQTNRKWRCWHCGQQRFAGREELAAQLGLSLADSRRLVRSLRVHQRDGSPMVRFTGRWLGALGFRTGVRVKIEARYGRLVLEARSFGRESR